MITMNRSALRNSALADTLPSASPSKADPAGFASLLRQRQAVATPPAINAPALPQAAAKPAGETASETKAPESTGHDDDSSPTPPAEASAPGDPADRSRALARSKARAEGASGGRGTRLPPPTEAAAKAAPSADATADKTDASSTTTAQDAALDPSVLQWLANLQRGSTTPATAAKAAGDAGGTSTAEGADTSATPTDALAGDARGGQKLTDLKGRAERDAADAARADAGSDAAAKREFALALLGEETRTIERPALPLNNAAAPVTGSKEAAASAAAAALAGTPTPSTGIAATTAVAIPTPVDEPDFAQALGLQLSMLAKDGVQTAELHLNPAEMGPVSVQIVMDGTQARIDFGADMAATRQAIEAGLPQLASALSDAGFTLAGGGVSQHAGGGPANGNGGNRNDGGDDQRGSGRIVEPELVKRVGDAAARAVRRGGVDLFA